MDNDQIAFFRELREIHGILLRILEALEPTPPDLGSPRQATEDDLVVVTNEKRIQFEREDTAEAARLK